MSESHINFNVKGRVFTIPDSEGQPVNITVTANTLPAGSDATVELDQLAAPVT